MLASRRDFLRRGMVGAGILVVGSPLEGAVGGLRNLGRAPTRHADPESEYFDWKSAAGRPVAFGEGGNSLLIVGNGGSVLVDCKNAPFGAALRREAAARGGTLELVINTHHHADHTGGNHAFTKDLTVLAHTNCKPRIERQMNRYISQAKEAVAALTASKKPAAAEVRKDARIYHDRMAALEPKEFEPTQLVGDREEVKVRGERLVLLHFGPGHTDNDLVVHLPERNLLHTGDLLFNGRHPFIDRSAGATTTGWIASLRKIIELCDDKTTVVPGHGEMTDVSGLRRQIEYFEKAREVAAAAIKDGKTRNEARALPLPGFEQYGPAARTLEAVYEELSESK